MGARDRADALLDGVREMTHVIDVERARFAGESSGFRWGWFFGVLVGFGLAWWL